MILACASQPSSTIRKSKLNAGDEKSGKPTQGRKKAQVSCHLSERKCVATHARRPPSAPSNPIKDRCTHAGRTEGKVTRPDSPDPRRCSLSRERVMGKGLIAHIELRVIV